MGAKLVDIANIGDDLIESCASVSVLAIAAAAATPQAPPLTHATSVQGMRQNIQEQAGYVQGHCVPDVSICRPVRPCGQPAAFGLGQALLLHRGQSYPVRKTPTD